MADATSITTIEEIYQFTSISGSNDDALMQNFIDRKTELFEKYCGLDSFYINDYIEYYDGDGTEYMLVKNNPLNSIAEIASDSDWTWGTDTVIDSSDYRIVKNRYN